MNLQVSRPISRLEILAELRYKIREFISFSESACEDAGISAQQYQLLQVAESGSEGRRTDIGYLADRMFLRHNSAVELVDRAARSGLVKREGDPQDLRRSIVVVTAQGHELLERLVPAHLAELDVRGIEIIRAIQSLLNGRGEQS